MTTHRILRTAKADLSKVFYLDESAQAATGSVLVTVSRLDGTVVHGPTAATGPVSNAYTYTFPGSDLLDELVVSWMATVGGDSVVLTDRIQVVGGFFFGLAEGRSVDLALANTTRYPTSLLVEKRISTEDEAERICGQAFVPRFARVSVSGTGREWLALPFTMIRAIRAVSIGGLAYGGYADLEVSEWGGIRMLSGWRYGRRNVVVELEHGHDSCPPEINRASKIRFKSQVMQSQSAVPDTAERRIVVDAQGGSTVYGSPTAERTGIPEVDAVYARWAAERPGFG